MPRGIEGLAADLCTPEMDLLREREPQLEVKGTAARSRLKLRKPKRQRFLLDAVFAEPEVSWITPV
jgi:hypothetical protein